VQPEIDILGIPVKTFGLMFALGFVAAGAVVARHLREIGKPVDYAYEIVFAALAGGLIGAKLYYVIEHGDFGSLLTGGGLVWYGGALGGAVAVIAWARWRGMLNVTLLDLCAVPLALGYAIGRIGCQLSGDGDYGTEWDGPWAMAYPDGTDPIDVPVHPTPIYETLAMGLVAYVLWKFRFSFRPGVLFAWYLVAAGLERFLVEFVRRNDTVLAGLTAPQFESLAVALAGVVWLFVVARRGGLRTGGEPAHSLPSSK
jgi:phosphatidylglycerol---prolipoprotein diacylglyceryl transferase